MEMEGRVALVTGSSRGIGRAIALDLATAGCNVAVNYASHAAAAEDVVARVRELGRKCHAYQADVSMQNETDSMVNSIENDLGSVEILVNNAGITRDRSFAKLAKDDWDKVLRVNLDGPYNLIKRCLGKMVEARWGRIINIASVVGQMGNFGQANYAVTKGGLIALTKTLARELATKGITVNAVAPGYIETDMTAVVPEAGLQHVRELTPMGRLGTAEEVAYAVTFLAHPRASFITGAVINVNGGMYM